MIDQEDDAAGSNAVTNAVTTEGRYDTAVDVPTFAPAGGRAVTIYADGTNSVA